MGEAGLSKENKALDPANITRRIEHGLSFPEALQNLNDLDIQNKVIQAQELIMQIEGLQHLILYSEAENVSH